ncbi:hypothetical protein [Enterococcus ratti]|uniref:Glycosyl transferase family 1 domain-containing protein n=1 Tax=Enterococcus ratti TaxID=150033 RepID=A0A1L8WJB9_9ENTE|nr:hypothetical protein [Enterococcus ratti]OJG81114.1 hypothetical protein RV14_GL000269 [Enterococcus ratti]
MKTGVIFIGDIIFCPFMKLYTDILEAHSEDYDILFWKRTNEKANYPDNYLFYEHTSKLNKNKLLKIPDFFRYQQWLKKTVKEKKYDKLIILTTVPGLLLSKELITKYQGKYIYDIRDYTYENFSFYKNLENKVIDNSYFTCISSLGFKNFLPQNDYILAHNMQMEELANQSNFIKKKEAPLNLVWIGAVRYYDQQIDIIDNLKNSKKINLIYHGIGEDYERLMDYVSKNQIHNVKFTGKYVNKEKSKLLKDADLLLNAYKLANQHKVKHLISNKYYDGLIYGIPQLVENDSYKQEEVEKRNLGVTVDPKDPQLEEKLLDYYFAIDEELFNKNKKAALSEIEKDQLYYIKKINDFVEMPID